jgi:putative transposase
VVEGFPHHVTQRGVRRQRTFFSDADYRAYLDIVRRQLEEPQLGILAYCLMPNHVHFVVVPYSRRALSRFFSEVHKRYARRTNLLNDWKGHMWQQRFYSVAMDEPHCTAAMRYVELNPVRAGLVRRASDWPWSSARANIGEVADDLVDTVRTQQLVSNWKEYLANKPSDAELANIRRQTRIGRPEGDDAFIDALELRTGRRIRRRRGGRSPNKGS